MSRKSRYSIEIFNEWKCLYEEGLSTRDIGKRYGAGGGTVHDRLITMGVSMRSPSVSRQEYHINEEAFVSLNSQQAAYWFGFICADGCLLERGTRKHVTLCLKESDVSHVEAFSCFLQSDYPILRSEKRKAVSVSVSSRRLFDDLVRHGCTPRKSLTLNFPYISPPFLHHFIRGYFDGDGSASFGGGSPTISFAGNNNFLAGLKLAIDCVTNAEGRLYPHCRSQAWYLVYRGQFKVPSVRDYMYQDATVWLPRKRDKLDGYAAGKRKGYPTANAYTVFAASAGNVSQATIRQYIEAQKGT